MLKFKAEITKRYGLSKDDIDDDAVRQHGEWRIPTVDEVDDTLSFMYADTVLQILRGQGIYYGYEVKRGVDNEIRKIDFDKIKAQEEKHVESSRSIQQARRAQRKLETKREPRKKSASEIAYREYMLELREEEKIVRRITPKLVKWRKISTIEAEYIVRRLLTFREWT